DPPLKTASQSSLSWNWARVNKIEAVNSTCQPPYLFNSRFQSRLRTPLRRQGFAKIFGNFIELGRHGGLSIFSHNRNPTVPRFARGDIDRNLAKQRDAESFRLAFAAATAKNMIAFAVGRRGKITHVLNDPEHRDIDLLEHGSGFASIDERNFLRRGYDDRARK